jgi:hypothetical protein
LLDFENSMMKQCHDVCVEKIMFAVSVWLLCVYHTHILASDFVDIVIIVDTRPLAMKEPHEQQVMQRGWSPFLVMEVPKLLIYS